MCEKTIKEKDIKLSCVSMFMSLPRAYEDPHERGALGEVEPFAKAHQLKPLKHNVFSNPCPVIRYINPNVIASLPHPRWCSTLMSKGTWIWWTCKNSVDGIRDISGWHRNKSRNRQCPKSQTNSTASAWTKRPHPPNVKSGIACDSTRNIVHSKKAIYQGGQKTWSHTFVVIWWSHINSVNGTERL